MAEVAVLGIDPGRRWTAGVLRVGREALHGWTLGPRDAAGDPAPAALDNIHDLTAWARYMARVTDQIEATMALAPGGGRVFLACEVVVPPGGRRIALADWLLPRQVLAAVLGYDPRTVLVRPDGHGRARPIVEHYPPALWPAKGAVGGRPDSWGPSEARQGERDHERAAYDVAGAAAAELLARKAVS
ncbi:hypothetical protein [Actinomadura xylanilytica]|uniref:hypothetical protein n=1 Tax=Actinomadura xylanilytica TaxID=887459 RepID=UPI00255AFE9E|nr:hypothetical protein [Actinomadura xylanilytica]MDL4777860.1 hypothetical protein [Actinomadura xylanilytica]